ncbi:MAG: PorP/SprF family type IX secretion system membrane protein [Bacteroidales bacterium]
MKKSLNLRIFIKAFIIAGAIGTIGDLNAQDPIFSQFYNNPLYYNPGNVGLNPGMRMRFNYRDQWSGLPVDFKTYNFSMDIAERNIPGSGGLGLIALSDRAGTGMIKTSILGLATAVRVPLQENMIAQVGIMASFVQKNIDMSQLVFADQLSARYGNIYQTAFEAPADQKVTYPDFTIGGVYRFSELGMSFANIQGTLGAAMHHVFTPNESFLGLSAPLPRKLVVHADLVFEIDQSEGNFYNRSRNPKSFKFNPGFNLEKQGDFSTFSIGLNVLKSSIYTGLWFRNQTFDFVQSNDLMITAGLYLPFNKGSRLKLMYSYDFVLTELATAAGASHEITIAFEFDDFNLFSGGGGGGRSFGSSGRGGRSYHEMECCPF